MNILGTSKFLTVNVLQCYAGRRSPSTRPPSKKKSGIVYGLHQVHTTVCVVSYPTEYTQSGNGWFLAYIPSWWKNQPWLVRVGLYAHPLSRFTLFTITYKVAVYAPAERADTLPLFHPYPICTLWATPRGGGLYFCHPWECVKLFLLVHCTMYSSHTKGVPIQLFLSSGFYEPEQ
jgi:hypothetical protein